MEGISLWRSCTVEQKEKVFAKYFELYFSIHHQWLMVTRGERGGYKGRERERDNQRKKERNRIEARIEAQSIQDNPKRVGPPTPLIFRIVAWRGRS